MEVTSGGGGWFMIAPNPTSDNLTMEKTGSGEVTERDLNSSYKLYDFSGDLVLEGDLSENSHKN